MPVGRGELGRIEDDHIERRPLGPQRAQRLEHVGLVPAVHAVLAVAPGVFGRHPQRLGRRIDRQHMRRATGGRRQREAAGVAEAVEHARRAAGRPLPLHQVAHQRAVVALVDVEAGLVAATHIDAVAHPMLVHRHLLGRLGAARHAVRCRQSLALPGRAVGAVVDVGAAGGGRQRIQQRLAPRLHAGGLELHHELARVAVGHQPGQLVGLAEHQPQRIAVRCQMRAPRHRSLHPRRQPAGVDRLALDKAPAARPKRGVRRERGPREPGAVARPHRHRGAAAGRALHARHRGVVHPRVAARQRALLAGLEDQFAGDLHGVRRFARGWAAS